MINATCKCGKQFSVDDSKAGTFVACPGCSKVVKIESSRPSAFAPKKPTTTKASTVNQRGKGGKTRLMDAAYLDQPELLTGLIAEGADVNIQDDEGRTALNYAYADHSFKPADILIEKGADLNLRDKFGRTVLFQAIEMLGNPEYIEKMLIKRGAKVDVFDNEGNSPIHLAIQKAAEDQRDVPKIKMLLANGADPNTKNNAGMGCLGVSALIGFPDLVDLFIEHGADVNMRDNNGNTPLILTAFIYGRETGNRYLLIVESLVSKGADVNARNASGATALDMAKVNGKSEMISLLLSKGAQEGGGPAACPPPDESAVSRDEEATEANNFACMLERDGKIDEALVIYEQLNQKYPDYKKAWRNRGMLLAQKENFHEAMICLKRALELDPAYLAAHIGLGLTYDSMFKYEMAVACYDRALKIDPYNTDALYNKGLSLKKSDRIDEAIDAFARVVKINPNDADAAGWVEKLKLLL